jgi:hypothetical protein
MLSRIKNPLSRNKRDVGSTMKVPKRGLNRVVHRTCSRTPSQPTNPMKAPIVRSANASRRCVDRFSGLRLFQWAHLARFDMASACGQSNPPCRSGSANRVCLANDSTCPGGGGRRRRARRRPGWERDAADLFLAEEELADVRPEFLGDVVQGGGFYLRPPIDRCLMRAALLGRVVDVGQSCF